MNASIFSYIKDECNPYSDVSGTFVAIVSSEWRTEPVEADELTKVDFL